MGLLKTVTKHPWQNFIEVVHVYVQAKGKRQRASTNNMKAGLQIQSESVRVQSVESVVHLFQSGSYSFGTKEERWTLLTTDFVG